MLEDLTRDAFAAQLNTKFKVFFAPEVAVETELTEVSELKKTSRTEAFSLVFLAPHEVPAEQSLYKVEHAEMGTFDLFLVPVKQLEQGIKYETIFNRLV